MPIMPIDRITLLLAQASEAEVASDEDEMGLEAVNPSDGGQEGVIGTAAKQALAATLERLSSEEIYELLALAALGDSEDGDNSWDLAVERARATAAENALDELRRLLVLTNAIEAGLERLGYRLVRDRDVTEETNAEGDEADAIEETEGTPSVAHRPDLSLA